MSYWSHDNIAELAGFEDGRSFSRDLSRYDLPIEAVPGSVRVKAARYSDIAATKALVLGELRAAGLSIERAAALVRRIDNAELAYALDCVGSDHIWIAFPLNPELPKCVIALDHIELQELVGKLGGSALIVDIIGVGAE